jgi:hypothetical protein
MSVLCVMYWVYRSEKVRWDGDDQNLMAEGSRTLPGACAPSNRGVEGTTGVVGALAGHRICGAESIGEGWGPGTTEGSVNECFWVV